MTNPDDRYNNWWAHFLDGFSLSGAIVLVFTSFIFIGIMRNQEKVWQEFATALTTFVSAKKVSEYETERAKRKATQATLKAQSDIKDIKAVVESVSTEAK